MSTYGFPRLLLVPLTYSTHALVIFSFFPPKFVFTVHSFIAARLIGLCAVVSRFLSFCLSVLHNLYPI